MPIKSAKPGYLRTRWKPELDGDAPERRDGKEGLGNRDHIGLMGNDSGERTDGAASVPQSVLLELADACLTLENLNTFADLAAAIAALQSAAKKTTAYLKGGN